MEKQVDIAVVGCGPAGLSAAVNIRVRNRSLLLIGPKLCSSSLHKAHKGQQAALSAVSFLEQSGVFSQEKLVKV